MADMETKCLRSFTFLKVKQREYREDQTPSNSRRTDNDMHDDSKKDMHVRKPVGIVWRW